jgi:acyl dehydratase
VFEGGAVASASGILEFACRYDPQTMHTDPAAAARGFFGGLIASGWHTAALMMRLFAAHFLSPASSLASPGIDELRWLRPLRPGDVLSLRVTVTEARRSHSKPEQGVVRSFVEVLNQNGEVVMSLRPIPAPLPAGSATTHLNGPRPSRPHVGGTPAVRQGQLGRGQPSHSQMPRPITHSRSSPRSHGNSSVNIAIAWR